MFMILRQKKAFLRQLLGKKVPAYSLLEVGIVLLIMGVIIGGVIKGTDLLDSAKLNNLAQQYNEFRLASYTFMDRYGGLPGNFSEASTRINANLNNGTGDGQLNGQGLSPGSEAHQFWQHLLAAKLLEGVTLTLGVPKNKVGGVWTIEQDPMPGMEGAWFVVGKPHGNRAIGGVVTPGQAQAILSKIDDANPLTGRVRVADGADYGSGRCLQGNGVLNRNEEATTCVLFFKL